MPGVAFTLPDGAPITMTGWAVESFIENRNLKRLKGGSSIDCCCQKRRPVSGFGAGARKRWALAFSSEVLERVHDLSG